VKYGGDLHKVNDFGNALHFACAEDSAETVEYLLSEKVLLSAKTKEGETPLHIAAINGSLNSFIAIINHYNTLIESTEVEEE
jgi:ankyrin repeat protein